MINNSLIDFLKTDLRIRHKSGRSSKIYVNDDLYDNFNDIITFIIGNRKLFKSNSNWISYYEDVKNNCEDFDEVDDVISNDISKCLQDILIKKTEVRTKANDETGSPFDVIYKSVPQPTIPMNSIDYEILSGIKYCKSNNCIYFKRSGTVRLIGSLAEVIKDVTTNSLCSEIKNNISHISDENISLGEFIQNKVKILEEGKRNLIMLLQNEIDNGKDWDDIEIKLNEENIFVPKKYSNKNRPNSIEVATDAFIIEYFWKIVPVSIFASKVVILKSKYEQVEHINKDGKIYKTMEWRGFAIDLSSSNDMLNEARYLKNTFTHLLATIKDEELFKLENPPRTYVDTDNYESLFKYDSETLKNNLPSNCYTKLEDCKNLMLLKSWMNEDEYRFAMAWAYAAIHPTSINSKIGLLLWTGGGTGKSSFVAMIKEAMLMASNAKQENLYFEVKGSKFDTDKTSWIPDGEVGLPKAALINIDEATTETIKIYKEFSGSAAGNRLAIRKLYENSTIETIHGKFIFTSNQGLLLDSDDGSLLRRLVIIKHKEIKNVIGGEAKSDDDIVIDYKRQVPMLLSEGKKAIEEIKNLGYDSIDQYAMKEENVTKNLNESTSTTVNELIYNEIYNKLYNEYKRNKTYDGFVRIQSGALAKVYENTCIELGEDRKYWNSFKRWIIENVSSFTSPNSKNQYSNFLKLVSTTSSSLTFENKNSNSIFELHPLKNQFYSDVENNIEISDENKETFDDFENYLEEHKQEIKKQEASGLFEKELDEILNKYTCLKKNGYKSEQEAEKLRKTNKNEMNNNELLDL